jgi:hypothetical protein
MTTDDIKYLFYAAYEYAEKTFGKKPNNIEIEEDGTITAKWSKYIGCGEYETTTESFKPEDVTERLEYYKNHFNN